ncbi:uncharacterized protein, partial [Littorina saxatilis]|uniref:uncharacterized protein n=1 Tax=Littorina saxatilis TaxID=31220 RepID=UPI0038B4A415
MNSVAELCGNKLTTLPYVRTIDIIGDQRLSLSYRHIEESLSTTKDTTLQSDETRKYGDTYEVFAIRDADKKEWVLGLREMVDKIADTCLDTFRTILSDIEDSTTTDTGKNILVNIQNTMSDRAATEKKFHTLLEGYREEILPQVYSNWDQLSTAEHGALTRVNNFYCGLHILVNFAEVVDKIVAKYESDSKEQKVGAEAHPETCSTCKNNESGAIRLVRTACKCFVRGADETSGCYGDFRTFLREKSEVEDNQIKKSQLIVPFRGNRFYILLYNSEAIFFLADDIKEFFKEVNSPANRLQKSVFYDIGEPLHLAVIIALALCSKLVTPPLWRYLEKRDCTIQEASSVYRRLQDFLVEAKQDCSDVLSGE